MLGSITDSGQQDLSRLERTWGGSSPRPVEYGALVLAHDALWVDFGARCAFSGWVLVCGAPFLGWILVRSAPFLGWILVRGMWCADFGADFGARCVVFGLDFGARCAVFGLDFGARCVVRQFWGRFRCTVCLFGVVFGVWRAVFGPDFGARCVVRRFWGGFRCTVRLFGFDFGALPFRDRFWCVVRCCWGRSQPAGNKIYPDWRGSGGNRARDLSNMGPWSWRMMPFWVDFGARCAFSGGFWCAVRRFWAGFWCAVCAVRRFWARYWSTVCGAPILGRISLHGAPFILVRGALMLGSITDSGQQDLSRLERTWGESSPRPVEYGALVLAHDALLGRFWCEVRLFGLGFGVRGWILVRGVWCADFGADFGARCVVFGLDFGARCAVFGLDFGARCVVRRFGAPILGPISVHGASFLGSILVRGAPFLGSILVRGVWCADFGADFGARCAFLGSFLVCGAPFLGPILVHGVWCADFGADFVARCAFLGSILARCLFGIDFGIDFGAWCADVGVDHSQRATRSIKTWTFCFLALCWAPLSWPQNVVTALFKTIASFLHA